MRCMVLQLFHFLYLSVKMKLAYVCHELLYFVRKFTQEMTG